MKPSVTEQFKAQNTKERIVLESAILFAKRGFRDVTIKDIAAAVGIQTSSLYYYFDKKESIFEEIISNTCDMYRAYFKRLDKDMDKATCFQDVLDGLFAELLEVYEIYIYYCLCLITTEQFRDETARSTFNNDVMRIGIENTKRVLDQCVERGWVKPFNTEIHAISLMNNVIVGNIMRTHEDMKQETVYEPGKMYADLKEMILNSVEVVEEEAY
ncbi:TetR/AcrR family transcriptional regulator [Eubacteriales bacterium OttesenSCG-928-N13]|nr:TetR/AcrR family transcriptional regulator [Eubacteriales bacterium OttesenSCG-928-N13]